MHIRCIGPVENLGDNDDMTLECSTALPVTKSELAPAHKVQPSCERLYCVDDALEHSTDLTQANDQEGQDVDQERHTPLHNAMVQAYYQQVPTSYPSPSALERQRKYLQQKMEAEHSAKRPNLPFNIHEPIMQAIRRHEAVISENKDKQLPAAQCNGELIRVDIKMDRPSSGPASLSSASLDSRCTSRSAAEETDIPQEGKESHTGLKLDEKYCAMRKRATFEKMGHTMTALSRWNKSTALFRAEKVLLPQNFCPTDRSVLLGHKKEFRTSPGNRYLKSLCEQFKNSYDTADREGKSDIVSTILTAIYRQCPVGAFLRYKDGRYYEVEDLLARDKIASDLRNFLPGKYRSSQKKRFENAAEGRLKAPISPTPSGEKEDASENSQSASKNSSEPTREANDGVTQRVHHAITVE